MTPPASRLGRAAIEDFLYREAELLNSGNYPEWLRLFTEDGIYWVPASPSQSDPHDQLSLYYEDRALRTMRVERLRDARAHALENAFRTSRVIGNVRILANSSTDIVVTSRFHLLEWHNERRRAFAGRYSHTLAIDGGEMRIRLKRVDLIDAEGAFEALQLIF